MKGIFKLNQADPRLLAPSYQDTNVVVDSIEASFVLVCATYKRLAQALQKASYTQEEILQTRQPSPEQGSLGHTPPNNRRKGSLSCALAVELCSHIVSVPAKSTPNQPHMQLCRKQILLQFSHSSTLAGKAAWLHHCWRYTFRWGSSSVVWVWYSRWEQFGGRFLQSTGK